MIMATPVTQTSFEVDAPMSFRENKNGPGHLQQTKVDPRVFAKYQKLIYDEAGIWLASTKTALLAGRLARRLRQLSLPDLDAYFDLVQRDTVERVWMLDAITTNETHFFREPKHFEFLEDRLFPRWKAEAEQRTRQKSLRIWSAGCSTGEEPYSLAMLLLEHFPRGSGWELEIVATDISTKVLAKAKAGIYSIAKAPEVPAHLRNAYMFEGHGEQDGLMKVSEELQRIVTFDSLNLNLDRLPISGTFDAIFCRNVLIYFDSDSKKKAINSLLGHLSPTGLLFVGHAENLHGVTTRVRTLAPTIYGRVGEDGRLLSDFRTLSDRHFSQRQEPPRTV
jgi:chemotaxis protein methyltransferase CheR